MAMQQKQYVFLDLLKALGIFQFIIWHTFINFYAYHPSAAFLYRSVFSVTGFFVFNSGFLIGCYYYGKLCHGMKWNLIMGRLFVRALKLLVIVMSAGFVVAFLSSKNILDAFNLSIGKIGKLFYADIWNVPLQVLVVIALTITVGYLILLLTSRSRLAGIVMMTGIVLVAVLDLVQSGKIPYLYRYFFQGLLGIYAGKAFYGLTAKETQPKGNLRYIAVCLILVFGIVEAFVVFSAPNYYFFTLKIIPQSIGVCSFFGGVGILCFRIFDSKKVIKNGMIDAVVHLGRHSLFVYLLQITIIDLIVILFKGATLKTELGCLVFSWVLFMFCVLSCQILKHLLRFRKVSYLYSLAFK